MATSSILGGDAVEQQHSGTGTGLLGPSDSTDSGSDTVGTLGSDEFDSDSDRFGTGERAGVDTHDGDTAADLLPDHVERFGGTADDDDGLADDAATPVAELGMDDNEDEDDGLSADGAAA
jgi:hypothetical protein